MGGRKQTSLLGHRVDTVISVRQELQSLVEVTKKLDLWTKWQLRMNLKMFRKRENYSLKEAVITLPQTAINFTIMKPNHSISCISEVKMTPLLLGQNCQKIIADLTIQLLYLQGEGRSVRRLPS